MPSAEQPPTPELSTPSSMEAASHEASSLAATPPGAAAWTALIAEHLPKRFADPQTLERLAERLELFSATDLMALELHLTRETPQIDLSQRFGSADAARRFTEGLAVDHFDPLLDLFARREPDGVVELWFETDIPSSPGEATKPEVFTCIGVSGEARATWIADDLAATFRSGGLTEPQRRTLIDAYAHLREVGGRPLYLFDLEPRLPGLVRLDVTGLEPAAMVDYLERFAPPAAVRQIAGLPAWIADVERHHLSFDIHSDGTIGPRLGTEMSNVKLPNREPRWGRMLDNLVADGLCDAETRDAIAAWTATDDRRTAAETWPALAELAGGCCLRAISHLKLVTYPDRPTEAKIYLLLRFLDRETLERSRRARTAAS